jgi:hypothetical protein
MKKRFLILVSLFCAILTNSKAQSDSLNHEIGFSTEFIFDQIFNSEGGPFDFMVKTRQPNSNIWKRYGLSTSYSFYNEHDEEENQSQSIVPSFGLERRSDITPKLFVNYGADIAFSYFKSINKNIYPDFDTKMIRNSIGGKLRPFIGLSFKIQERLYINTEASANLSGSRSFIKAKSYDTTTNQAETWESDAISFNFKLAPASAI